MRTFMFLADGYVAFSMMVVCQNEETAPPTWDTLAPKRFRKETVVRSTPDGSIAMVVYIQEHFHPTAARIWQCFDALPHEIRGEFK